MPLGTLDGMGEHWLHPSDEPVRDTTVRERGEMLIELLDLTDALPPVDRHDLGALTFAELCERR